MKTDSRHLLAVGLFGSRSRLGDRIGILLRPRHAFSPRVSPHRLALSAALLAVLLLTASRMPRWIAFAQTARPTFEVASVKLNSGYGPSHRDLTPGGMTYTNRARRPPCRKRRSGLCCVRCSKTGSSS